jgi:hypothetical protein
VVKALNMVERAASAATASSRSAASTADWSWLPNGGR